MKYIKFIIFWPAILVCMIIWIFPASGQGNMQFTYGSSRLDKCNDLSATPDGGYILAGESESFSKDTKKVIIIKTDGKGNVSWSKIYDNGVYEMPNSILLTSDGGYLIAGERYPNGGNTELAYLFKIDGNGMQQWSRIYDSGGNMAEALAAKNTLDGGFIITGRAEKTLVVTDVFLQMTSELRYLYLLKAGNDGVPVWSKKYNTGDEIQLTRGNDVFPAKDGGYIIACEFKHNNGSRNDLDMGLLKVNGKGEVEWIKRFGGNKSDAGSDVLQTKDGGYLLSGETESYGAGKLDICLIKTDKTGGLLWAKTYGGSNFDQLGAVAELDNGGFAIAGKTTIDGKSDDVLIITTDAMGVVLNSFSYGGSRLDNSSTIKTTNNKIILGGNTMSFGSGSMDMLFLVLNLQKPEGCNLLEFKPALGETRGFSPAAADMSFAIKTESVSENRTNPEKENKTRVIDAGILKKELCR